MADDNKYTDEFFEQFGRQYTSVQKQESEVEEKARPKKAKVPFRLIICLILFVISFAITFFILQSCDAKKPKEIENNGVNDSETADNTEENVPEIINPYVEPDELTVALGDEVNSQYAVLIERESGRIVAQKNYNVKMFPASLTKIMTLLVAVEQNENLNETFEMTFEIIDPLYRQDASLGADATYALAVHTAGSEAAFVELMNAKVEKLGLKNTRFANTSGLHDENNYTTAYDMAIILKAASENELAAKILSTYQYTTNPTPQHPNGILLTSTLFSRMVGDEPENDSLIVGGKTGFVNESGNCIASYGKAASEKEYIFVTGNAKGVWKAVFDHIRTYQKYVNQGGFVIKYPLLLRPVTKDYLWGGERLKNEYSFISDSDKIAEAWMLSCHKAGTNVIAN